MRRLFCVLAALMLVTSALAISACGDDDDDDGGGEVAAVRPRRGGEITIAQTSQPDYLDPALTYTVQRLGAAVARLHPAADLQARRGRGRAPSSSRAWPRRCPEISEDGKTYEFTHPQGHQVLATARRSRPSDFEHTIKRVLNLESGGSRSTSASRALRSTSDAGKADGDIAGIETDDKTGKVTINLTAAGRTVPQRARR